MLNSKEHLDKMWELARSAVKQLGDIPCPLALVINNKGEVAPVDSADFPSKQIFQYILREVAQGMEEVVAIGTISSAWMVKRTKETMDDIPPSEAHDREEVVVVTFCSPTEKIFQRAPIHRVSEKEATVGDLIPEEPGGVVSGQMVDFFDQVGTGH